MSFRGIKWAFGESSLERKIRVLFGICLLLLITGSFLWVNRKSEDLIRLNTRDKARDLKPHHILRVHLPEKKFQDDDQNAKTLFESLANQAIATVYDARVVVLDDSVGRRDIKSPIVATDPQEIALLSRLLNRATADQQLQNQLEVRSRYPSDGSTEPRGETTTSQDFQEFNTDQTYVLYTPLVFESKGACIGCHFPVARQEDSIFEMSELQSRLGSLSLETEPEEFKELELNQLQMVPPMFLRITLNNKAEQTAIAYNRSILISVGIVTAVLAVAAIWLIVRYWIVKPLNYLREVTEQVGAGRLEMRVDLETGDELEQLGRSFNRMMRHLQDAQTALENANEDLDLKVEELAQVNLKLHEMNQLKSEFLANMSHELRTPLNSIIGFSEILETAKGMEPKHIRFVSNIRHSGRLLLDLINDILDLAKLEAGKMEINPTEFSIHQLVFELCEMVRQLAEQKQIPVLVCCPDDFPLAFQDKIKVRQILTNLLSNAIKFTPEGGRISVNVKQGGEGELVMEVADTGIGISTVDQQIIFQKFRQGSSALGSDSLTREVSGTGLGLSIVKELCVLLGGDVVLRSEIGEGSTFTVSLPWSVTNIPYIDAELSKSLDQLTRQNRLNFERANQVADSVVSRDQP